MNPYTFDNILDAVCQHFKVTRKEILSDDKHWRVAKARLLAMFLVYRWIDISSVDTGKRFGRDRTTVLHARKAVMANTHGLLADCGAVGDILYRDGKGVAA